MRDVILTAYLTGQPDPQRGTIWPVDNADLLPLLTSSPVPVVVFANELSGPFVERVEAPKSVYFDRWRHIANYLRAHEDIRFAWCVDATDVVVFHDPFPHMRPGKLYIGSEPVNLRSYWMVRHHRPFWRWMKDNASLPLLNCGLVGGDRETVLRFAERMGQEQRGCVMDMGAANFLAYEEFDIVTGPMVHTLYKAEEANSLAWFKHK